MFLSTLSTICRTIGATVLLLSVYKVFQFLNLFFFSIPSPKSQLQSYKHLTVPDNTVSNPSKQQPTHWALITGSTGGIGFGYAHHLLSLNFGVLILAHIESEVHQASLQLQEAHPQASIKTAILNCQTASPTDIEALVASISDLPITILINNVGGVPMPFPNFRPFAAFDAQGIDAHFDMNARFMTHLTRLMLPHLIRHAHPRALILNVTSAARHGLPYLSMYSATKGYVSAFSHSISREMKYFKQPVDCLLIVPGDVVSDGNCISVAPGSPLAKDYARMVLERVDGAVGQGRLEISPYWKHAIQIWFLGWLPESLAGPEATKVTAFKMEGWAKANEKWKKR